MLGAEVTVAQHGALQPRIQRELWLMLFMPGNKARIPGGVGERAGGVNRSRSAIPIIRPFKKLCSVEFLPSHFHSQLTTVDSLVHALTDFFLRICTYI